VEKSDMMNDPVELIRVTLLMAARAMALEVEKIAPEVMNKKGYTKAMLAADSSKMDEVMKEVHEDFLKTETHTKNEILWESLLRRLGSLMSHSDAVGFYAAAGQLLVRHLKDKNAVDEMEAMARSLRQTDDSSSSPSDPGRS
jgi:hypothetical protein